MVGRLVIRRSRWKATVWSLVCVAFVTGGISLAQPGTLGAVLVGYGGAVFFGLGLLIFARDAVRPRVQLVLSPEGLEQRAAAPRSDSLVADQGRDRDQTQFAAIGELAAAVTARGFSSGPRSSRRDIWSALRKVM